MCDFPCLFCLCHQVTEPHTSDQDVKTIYYVILALQGEDLSWLVWYLLSLSFFFVFKIRLTTIQCFIVFPQHCCLAAVQPCVFGIKLTNLEDTNTVENEAGSSLTFFS